MGIGAAFAAVAFLTAAQRFFVAAMIRARPSGLGRRFFLAACAGAGAQNTLGCFVDSERDRPFEALRPGDENPDAAAERVRGDPGFERLSEALPGGLGGRIDALPPNGAERVRPAPVAPSLNSSSPA